MYLRVLVCEITHVQYEISVVSTLKFWEKGLSFWASSVVDQWFTDLQLGRKCILFKFISNLNHNIILCKRSAPYLNLICTLLPEFVTLHIPLPVTIVFLLNHNYGTEEEDGGKLTWFSKWERWKKTLKKYGKWRTE